MLVKTSYVDALAMTALTEHIASGGFTGPFNGAKVALITSVQPITPGTKWTDLTEATFTGYAQSAAVVWGANTNEGDGSISSLSDMKYFAASGGPVTGNMLTGYALVDAAGPPNLLAAELFATPIPIVSAGDGFGLVVKLNYGEPNQAEQGYVIR